MPDEVEFAEVFHPSPNAQPRSRSPETMAANKESLFVSPRRTRKFALGDPSRLVSVATTIARHQFFLRFRLHSARRSSVGWRNYVGSFRWTKTCPQLCYLAALHPAVAAADPVADHRAFRVLLAVVEALGGRAAHPGEEQQDRDRGAGRLAHGCLL